MSKLLSSVLDRISENNNEYRNLLRNLNGFIEEVTTTLVGEVVATSSYSADFSDTLVNAKEKLVNPITKQVESYVIKDLRSVETVNEQFVEKINDKIENANITTKEEKDAFTNNLNVLLNEKYLEIVKIKRVDFFDENGLNDDVEACVIDFISYLKENATFDETSLNELFSKYKNEVYSLISKSLKEVSDLYLNNFVNEVSSALNGAIDFDTDSYEEKEEEFKPFIPEINPVPEIDVPLAVSEDVALDVPVDESFELPEVPDVLDVPEIPEVPVAKEKEEPVIEVNMEEDIPSEVVEEKEQVIDVKPIAPIEIKEEETPKRSYDVEEILKIAKSPIVTMPEVEPKKNDSYVNVEPIVNKKDSDTMESEFNEREIVEEMIKRLTKRLNEIDERRKKYEVEQAKLSEDENFVNSLIESSNTKKEELDKFEEELDNKDKELASKRQELDKKINDVMPFANALLNTEKES